MFFCLLIGSDVTVNCEAEGFPIPEISWFVNGNQISDSDKFRLNKETGSLTIIDASMEDDGRYLLF